MRDFESYPGESVEDVVERMVALAKNINDAIRTDFNGTILTATPISEISDIVQFYYAECRRERERVWLLQGNDDSLMRQLPDLDFKSDVALLNWLVELHKVSFDSGIVIKRDVIIATFAAHGYYAGMNCGEGVDANNRDVHVRWLIGQALATLQGRVGAIFRAFDALVRRFKQQFNITE